MPAAEVRFHREIRSVPIEQIRPNSFNSNEVSASEQAKIKEDILANGFFGAILVRPVPSIAGEPDTIFEIVDGEHRWIALKEIGVTEVPCLVVEHDETQAQINSIRLNTERGNQNPKKVGKIIQSLEASGITLPQLAHDLIYTLDELADRKDLILLPDNMEAMIRAREAAEREEMSLIFSFMVPAMYQEYVDRAVEMFGDRKGKSFGEMCKRFVEESEAQVNGQP